MALNAIKNYGQGLPAVITFGQANISHTRDGYTYAEACKALEDNGAAVVGLNCSSGPQIMTSIVPEIRQACKGPIACLPVPYRTTVKEPHMHSLTYKGKKVFPDNLDGFMSTCDEIGEFGSKCADLRVQYIGLCCGNSSRYFRKLAETCGRDPPASQYSSDISQSWVWGQSPGFVPHKPKQLVM